MTYSDCFKGENMNEKRQVLPVKCKGITFGDGQITIQSMLNVRSDEIEKSIVQAVALEQAGCDVVRIAVPDHNAVRLVEACLLYTSRCV